MAHFPKFAEWLALYRGIIYHYSALQTKCIAMLIFGHIDSGIDFARTFGTSSSSISDLKRSNYERILGAYELGRRSRKLAKKKIKCEITVGDWIPYMYKHEGGFGILRKRRQERATSALLLMVAAGSKGGVYSKQFFQFEQESAKKGCVFTLLYQ